MKTLFAFVAILASAAALAAGSMLVSERTSGDKKICYYLDGTQTTVKAWGVCPVLTE